MRPGLAALAATLLLAGCLPAQQPVPFGPGFYPSAIAWDPAADTLLVASFATGAVVALDRAGRPVATVRPGAADRRLVQIALDPARRVLWSLLPGAIEVRELDGTGAQRIALPGGGRAGGARGDLALDRGSAYVLDAAAGQVLRVRAQPARVDLVATLPITGAAAPDDDGPGPPGVDGAIAALPGGNALFVALGGRMWRVSVADGARTELALAHPLSHVSQLAVLASTDEGTRMIALRGYRNELVALRVSADGPRIEVDERHRIAADTPLRAAFDGRALFVLLSPVRHHPALGGDGRPNVPGRLVRLETETLGLAPLRVAHATGD
ncbi:MAG: hypothetical protein KJ025_20755 [Burkholderiales bacterium]|nr:hypothetical protein [Burkholderiales bacterium]